jgi:hypothetical protein
VQCLFVALRSLPRGPDENSFGIVAISRRKRYTLYKVESACGDIINCCYPGRCIIPGPVHHTRAGASYSFLVHIRKEKPRIAGRVLKPSTTDCTTFSQFNVGSIIPIRMQICQRLPLQHVRHFRKLQIGSPLRRCSFVAGHDGC